MEFAQKGDIGTLNRLMKLKELTSWEIGSQDHPCETGHHPCETNRYRRCHTMQRINVLLSSRKKHYTCLGKNDHRAHPKPVWDRHCGPLR